MDDRRQSWSAADRILEALTFGILIGTFVLAAVRYPTLPAQIPSHFNAAGQADGWSGRGFAWFSPILGLLVCGLIFGSSFLPRGVVNLPFRVKPERADRVYGAVYHSLHAMNLECAVLFAALEWASVQGGNLSPWGVWGPIAALLATTVWMIRAAYRANGKR